MTREPSHPYVDPLDAIWIRAAERLGMRVERVDDAYASWDGCGTLRIARRAHLDADDCLAQMVLHEICHALVAGERGRSLVDWGLDNTSDQNLVDEQVTNRLQAALADRYGLRVFFATTTEHRSYYDSLGPDPLAGDADPAAERARAAFARAKTGRWWEPLQEALRKTAELAAVVRGSEAEAVTSLWSTVEPLHRAGFVKSKKPAIRCGDCAWFADGFCRQSSLDPGDRVAVDAGETGCVRFEARFDEGQCAQCGACCRQGFDVVEVDAGEALVGRHPEMVTSSSGRLVVPRPEGRCLALVGTGTDSAPYRCRVYECRPRSCAEFEVGGDACLEARRRVGLSA